jgi:glycosyltransferase involved in cell wall biosynthesis
LRILLLHNYYQRPGGEDFVVANEKVLLEQEGHSVEVLAARNESISGFVGKLNAFMRTAYNSQSRRALKQHIAMSRPDVVHVHNTFPLLSASIFDACAEACVPVIQTLHNFRLFCAGATLFRNGHICELCLDGQPYRAVIHRCYRGSVLGSLASAHAIAYHRKRGTWLKKVTRFIALSNFARNKFIEAGLPPDRIVVKPNFIRDPGPPDIDRRHSAIFVGRLSPEKGVAHLLQAWSGIDLSLHILGDGPQRNLLEKMAPPNVIFDGHVEADRVRAAMRSAKFLVVPSLSYDSFPMVVVEAFANGLPVLAFRQGALSELVDDGITGRLVDKITPHALAAAARDLLDNPDTLKSMSLAARQRYNRSYTPKHNLHKILAIYRDAIAEANLAAAYVPARHQR